MTQTHILKSSKLSSTEVAKSTKAMVLGRVENKKISFPKGKHVKGQWYVQKKDIGHYRVVHNLNTLLYGVSVSSEEPLSIETKHLTEIAFEVFLSKNSEPYDATFSFALNFYG